MIFKQAPGGVHPHYGKELSAGKPILEYLPQGEMVFPLSQHIGKPAKPVVKKGDPVLAGQIIAEADGFVSANIICSCSGKVKNIERRLTAGGTLADCIVIDNDGEYSAIEGIGVKSELSDLSDKDIMDRIKAAGIVGLGGAGFPTHVKLTPPDPAKIDTLIINGAECEPYITCDDYLMCNHPDWIRGGIQVLKRLFPRAGVAVCTEDNKPKAVKAMQEMAATMEGVEVFAAQTRYPVGCEKPLIAALTGRHLTARELPASAGCIVCNVTTVSAIYRAVLRNTPLMEKFFTISGDAVADPKNICVRIGCSYRETLEAAGGLKAVPKKVICGGPMMGTAVSSLDIPIVKANNALLCFAEDEVEQAEKRATNCIHCGRCSRACPQGLVPSMMADAALKKDYDRYENLLHGLECYACGSCTFECPARRPLMQIFKQTKATIMASKQKR